MLDSVCLNKKFKNVLVEFYYIDIIWDLKRFKIYLGVIK